MKYFNTLNNRQLPSMLAQYNKVYAVKNNTSYSKKRIISHKKIIAKRQLHFDSWNIAGAVGIVLIPLTSSIKFIYSERQN